MRSKSINSLLCHFLVYIVIAFGIMMQSDEYGWPLMQDFLGLKLVWALSCFAALTCIARMFWHVWCMTHTRLELEEHDPY